MAHDLSEYFLSYLPFDYSSVSNLPTTKIYEHVPTNAIAAMKTSAEEKFPFATR